MQLAVGVKTPRSTCAGPVHGSHKTDEIVSDASPSSHLPLLSLCDPIDFLSDCHCAALAQRFLASSLAEPIGKAAAKLKKKLPEKKKEARKKAKRRGLDVEAAAAAVEGRRVALPLQRYPAADCHRSRSCM